MVFIQRFANRIFAAILLVSSISVSVYAQPASLSAMLPLDTNVIKGKFANGLTYYIRQNDEPANKVELRLIVNAGSILEDEDQQGLAHFMEHMNFNGTKNFEKNELVSYLQSIGVAFGADLNAYTSFDETVYILPIPTDKKGNVEKGFQILEDWAHNALLTNKDIDEERAVVLEESRMGKGADQRMLDKYLPELMEGSRYAQRLPIGKDDILKNFKYDRIRAFYKDWYRPDMMAVAIAGDIDTATAMRLLRKHFATLKNPEKARNRFLSDVPSRTTASAMVVTDKEATSYQLGIIFPTQKAPLEVTVGDYRNMIARNLAIQMLNQRFADLTRSAEPPFLYAGAGFDSWARGYESFSAFTVFGDGGLQQAMNAVTAELLRAEQYGFTAGELEMAKKNAMAGIERAYNERDNVESADLVAEYGRNFLENEPIPGIENEYSYYRDYVPGISLDEINAMVKSWTKNKNTFSLITGPENKDASLPNDAELLRITQSGFTQRVEPFQEKAIAASLMEALPKAGKVTGKKAEKDFDATTYTLSNGIKVTIKPTTHKNDEILLTGVKKGGTSNYGVADKSNAQYATSIVSAMGIGDFSPTDLEKVLAGKSVRASASLGDIETNISGSSTVKDFETMLQLLHLRMTQPRKDEALFKAYRDKQKTAILFASANPQVAFYDTVIKTLYNNNPLAPSPVPKQEDFDAIDLDRALDIYKKEFGTADGYHVFIAGNVDEKTMLPLIETYMGSISATGKQPTFRDNGVRRIPGKHVLKVYKGTEPQSVIVSLNSGEIKYSEDLALRTQALAEVLNIKVIETLREKLGGIYSGGYGGSVRKEPYEHYSISMQLPCGPENVDTLLKAAAIEIEQIKQKGPDAKDLEKVVVQWKEQHRENLTKNGYWIGKMEDVLFWDNNIDHVLRYEAWISKLKPADIQETAKLLLNGKNEFTAILYPEAVDKKD